MVCLLEKFQKTFCYYWLSGEEDSTSINWMVLKKGEAIRCACGNVFQLVSGKTNALAD